jgi:salicylate hydroxylase
MSLALAEVADNPGIRIRWSDLYRTLREPIADRVLFGTTVEALDLSPADGATLALRAADGGTRVLEGVDLVIAADGRYSPVRAAHFGRETPRQLGVVIYRVLMEADESAPVDDYGQWFNGPNRLLAFRVPGDAVYCAGTFTIPAGAPVPEDMRTPERLAALYVPPAGLDRASAFLVDGIVRNLDQIHWARMQEGTIRFAHPSGRLLLLGDAAHPMVPTLGQGATMAIEDGCVTADALDEALAAGTPLADVPATVAARRTERVAFAMDFSVEASDTLLPDTDVVAATREKTAAPFRDKLVRLYRHGP